MAQVTRQNPVEGLEQADSKISLSVEHRAVFCSSSVICLQLGLSLLKRMFFKRKAWTGAMTAHGPPSNCSSAVCSFSQKTNPWVHLRKIEADTPPLEGLPQTRSTTSLFNSDMTNFLLLVSPQALLLQSQQPKGEKRGLLRPTCKPFPRMIVHFSLQVEPVALATSYLCCTTQSSLSGWQQTGG